MVSKKICGIYQILNTITRKCYIGKSVNILKRWCIHKNDLRNQKHSSNKLQRAWDKYGEDIWEWHILQECEKDQLKLLEAFWMTSFNAVDNGYNIIKVYLEDGIVHHGVSPETRLKLSKAGKGKKLSKEQIEFLKNRKISEEHKRRISECKKGSKHSKESLKKMRNSHQEQANFPKRFQDLQELAESKGGKCLSQEYQGINIKLTWQCEENHIWEALPTNIRIGSWCPECFKIGKLTSLKDIQELAESKGGKCLSTIFVGSLENHTWQCEENHIWEATPSNIKQGSWCPECNRLARIGKSLPEATIEKMKRPKSEEHKEKMRLSHLGMVFKDITEMDKKAAEKEGKCLSIAYLGWNKKLTWQCKEGHVWATTPGNIKRGLWCPICAKAKQYQKKLNNPYKRGLKKQNN
jgi:group I intron endonuclease